MLINSGSASNLISLDSVPELKHQGLKIELQPCKKRPMLMEAETSNSKASFSRKFQWSKQRFWQRTLFVRIIHVGPAKTFSTGNCNNVHCSVDGTFVGEFKEKYCSVERDYNKNFTLTLVLPQWLKNA